MGWRTSKATIFSHDDGTVIFADTPSRQIYLIFYEPIMIGIVFIYSCKCLLWSFKNLFCSSESSKLVLLSFNSCSSCSFSIFICISWIWPALILQPVKTWLSLLQPQTFVSLCNLSWPRTLKCPVSCKILVYVVQPISFLFVLVLFRIKSTFENQSGPTNLSESSDPSKNISPVGLVKWWYQSVITQPRHLFIHETLSLHLDYSLCV